MDQENAEVNPNDTTANAEAQATADAQNAAATGSAGTDIASEAPAAWEPEPRQWLWADIFKAPLIACKFRCMLVSIVTIAAMGLVSFGFNKIPYETYHVQVLGPFLTALSCIILAIIFGLGATLVAIFIKSELLDDDYPTISEAIGQYKKRILAAIMVPLFLVGTLKFMHLGAYLYTLLCSVPYAGSILYFGSVPSFFIWLLITFFSIGVVLSMFVFPAIVAIRKHGWFDNVIDTLEAVGTKPHKVVASMLITGLLMLICCGIGLSALYAAKVLGHSPHLPGYEIAKTEAAADKVLTYTIPDQVFQIRDMALYYNPSFRSYVHYGLNDSTDYERVRGLLTADKRISEQAAEPQQENQDPREVTGYYQYFTGAIAGIFQTIIIYLIAGLGLNIIVAGGMLTYLHVREDDYWDDEDLADLEELAKELEEEALKEQKSSPVVPAVIVPAENVSPIVKPATEAPGVTVTDDINATEPSAEPNKADSDAKPTNDEFDNNENKQ